MLSEYSADPLAKDADHQAPLHIAAINGYVDVAEALIAQHKNIDVAGKRGMTPLMFAAAAGKTSVVGLLLRKKASLKAKCNSGWQSLHHAAFNGHAELVELLLRKKAAVDARTTNGRTPLMLSAMSSFSVTDLLLRKGAQLDARCSNGNQALHYACDGDAKVIIRHLLESGAKIEAEGHFRRRAIHIAVANGYTDQLQILLENGANVDARDAGGERALCMAAAAGQLQSMKMLIDHGAVLQQSFESTDHLRESPLCVACKHGRLELAVELITRGAGINERDAEGWRPLRYAVHHGWPEVVELLLANGASATSIDNAYDMSAGFITFAPNVDEHRRERIKTLLQLAVATERTLTNTAPVRRMTITSEAEGLQTVEPSERRYASTVDRNHGLQRQRTFHPGADSASGIAALASLLQPAATDVPSVSRHDTVRSYEQNSSPIVDGTYRLEWPLPQDDSSSRQHDWSQWHPLPTPSRHVPSSPQPQTSTHEPSAPARRIDARPIVGQADQAMCRMTQQERQLLRDMRCVACAGMDRDMPDFSCARCRQNIFREQHTEANRRMGSRHVYEME